jgi:hypothetical protein
VLQGVGSHLPVVGPSVGQPYPYTNRHTPGQIASSQQPVLQPLRQQRQAMMTDAMKRFSAMQSWALSEGRDTESHEVAHKSAAGHLAGSISFGYRTLSMQLPDGSKKSVTYAASGSVPIAMPGVADVPPTEAGRQNLQRVQADLKLAFAGATAPHHMSSADSAIAASASSKLRAVSAMLASMPPCQGSLGAAVRGPRGQRLNIMA